MAKIKIGVFGAYRGMTMVNGFLLGSFTGSNAPEVSHIS